MKTCLIVMLLCLTALSLAGCGKNDLSLTDTELNSHIANHNPEKDAVSEKVVKVTVEQKEGAMVYAPQFDNINIIGNIKNADISKTNKVIFDWDPQTTINQDKPNNFSVWYLDPSEEKASLVVGSYLNQGKTYNIPKLVSWSPDESKIIVYLANEAPDSHLSVDPNLYSVNPDGSELSPLTTFEKKVNGIIDVRVKPLWDQSCDNIFFIYHHRASKERENKRGDTVIKSVNIKSKEIRDIAYFEGDILSLDWLNEREILIVHDPEPEYGEFVPRSENKLITFNTQTGERKPFVTGGKAYSRVTVSPDGTKVAFFSYEYNTEEPPVFKIASRSGKIIKVIRSFSQIPKGNNIVWSPDSRKIAYVSSTKDSRTGNSLNLLDISKSQIEEKQFSDLKPIGILKWSDDGKIYLISNNRDSLFTVYDPN